MTTGQMKNLARALGKALHPRNAVELSRLLYAAARGYRPIYIDYPPTPVPRYGWGKPPHRVLYEMFDKRRATYIECLDAFAQYRSGLSRIPADASDSRTPYWRNPYIGGVNAAALYCFPAILQSRLYVEIGSGNSTKFVRQSITDNSLRTKLISIDPQPRAEIDALCDQVIRSRVEDLDLALFSDLHDGDILMVDNSHRCFQNSDVTVTFLEILPELNPGVLVYIDDVYLPYDYPPSWARRHYSEQYPLAVMLMADAARRYEIVLPHVFMAEDATLSTAVHKFWQMVGRSGTPGNGIWLRVKAPTPS